MSTITENYLTDMETTTLASFDTSFNTLPTTPHQVGTIIAEVPSPDRQNLSHFWDDDAQYNGYDSGG